MSTLPRGSRPVQGPDFEPLKIIPVNVGKPIIFRFLDDPMWVPTHHIGRGNYPCFGEGDCEYHRLSLIWKAYVAAVYWSLGKCKWLAGVAELTTCAAANLPKAGWRGWVCELKRVGPGNRSRLKASDPYPEPEVCLDRPFDITPVLRKLWTLQSFPWFAEPDCEQPPSAPELVHQPPPPRSVAEAMAQIEKDRRAPKKTLREVEQEMVKEGKLSANYRSPREKKPDSSAEMPETALPKNGHANGTHDKRVTKKSS